GKLWPRKCCFVNIYAPVGGDPSFFHRLISKLQQFPNTPMIVGEDFNEVLDLQLDRSLKTKLHVSGTNKAIHSLISDFNLVDIWRVVNPTTRDHRHNSYSRLDYFLISRSLVGDTFATNIEVRSISDHAPIIFTHSGIIELETSKSWRLNVSLLHLPEVQLLIKETIAVFFICNPRENSDMGLLWDTLKAVLRGRLISFATNRKRACQKRTVELEQEIKDKELALKLNFSLESYHALQFLKYEYNKIISQSVEFALFRVSQSYFEAGEKASKLLAYRLHKLTSSKTIHLNKSDSNKFLVTNKDINSAFKQFYSKLYTTESMVKIIEVNDYLARVNLPSLNPKDRDLLETPISIPEIKKAIESIKSGKAPGPG
uniref:Endonuclease/exonuclease/phosphatase domain-containing protein n=1 Tax=Latimeria chalumnae TaxID=7897 RepID=H3APK9_LATCH